MQSSDLYKYIENPELLDRSSVDQLQQVVKDFPYFQSAHLLLSLASKKWDASVYQKSLKKTAIVVSNRSHLFDLIHRLENPEVKVQAAEIVSAPVSQKVEAAREIEILKETEIAIDELPTLDTAKDDSPEQVLEKEIGKQVVTAFVEKEILKTPDSHRPLSPIAEPGSFGDWLNFLKKDKEQSTGKKGQELTKKEVQSETGDKSAENETPIKEKDLSRKQKNKAIMDRIIERNPGLIRTKEEQKFFTPDLKAKESLLENEHLVTETLARIYALQGNVNKAIRAYEILSLKNPQKSAYFASLIQKLKNN